MAAKPAVRVCDVENRSVAGRRLVILADGHLDAHFGKTTMGILRYREAEVVAVIDRETAGSTTEEALGVGGPTPIVGTLDESLDYQPDSLLIGVATRGGMIPPEWRPILSDAITYGLDIINGLHDFLNDDSELSAAAERVGVRLTDVRRPPMNLTVAEATPHRQGSIVVTMVGSDCAVGKMSVALDIESSARERGMDMQFVATGQTGMMISGNGLPLDRVIGDFMSGAVEAAVLEATSEHDVVLVEGQGSLLHPGYSGVTLSLIHGSQPDAMILTIMPARKTIEDYDVEIPPTLELIEIHESAASWIKPAPVIAVAVNSSGLTAEQAQKAIEAVTIETGLPATDTFLHGAGVLVEAIEDFRSRH